MTSKEQTHVMSIYEKYKENLFLNKNFKEWSSLFTNVNI